MGLFNKLFRNRPPKSASDRPHGSAEPESAETRDFFLDTVVSSQKEPFEIVQLLDHGKRIRKLLKGPANVVQANDLSRTVEGILDELNGPNFNEFLSLARRKGFRSVSDERVMEDGIFRARKVQLEGPRGGLLLLATPVSHIDLGIFFFKSDDERISGNYALHAKKAVCQRVAEREPRVQDSGWQVLSGDLLGPEGPSNIQLILNSPVLSPDSSRVDPALKQIFAAGRMPGFVPYVIGMWLCPLDALRFADTRMKNDKVAGYLGLATFVLPNLNALMEISNGLCLPTTSLHSA